MKGQRGITLVALVITVIVMLILAGVAISTLTSDASIFQTSNTAAERYEQQANEQMNEVKNLMNLLTNFVNDYSAANPGA